MTQLTQRDQELLDEIQDVVEDAVESTDVKAFTDPKAGLRHGHKPNKHRIDELVVNNGDNPISHKLDSNPNSHDAVHEAYFRADELGLSKDTEEKLGRLRKNDDAPIPPESEVELSRKYQ